MQNLYDLPASEVKLTDEDQKLVDELNQTAEEITKLLEAYDFAHAAEKLYHYFWHTFADKIIDAAKPKLNDPDLRASAQKMLSVILETSLKLLHPFMPFVTEAIWQLKHRELLMMAPWPVNVKNPKSAK
jgi:valyl-tRNA synthetase